MGIFVWILILAFLFLLLFAPIFVEVQYEQSLFLEIRYFFLKLHPLLWSKKKEKKSRQEEHKPESKTQSDKKSQKKPEETLSGMKRLTQKINFFRQLVSHILRYTQKFVQMKRFFFEFTFGTGDAAETGILSGLAWGISYGLLRAVSAIICVKDHQIKINPIFNQMTASVQAKCIIRTRLVHIIIIGIIAGVQFLKYKMKKGGVNHE